MSQLFKKNQLEYDLKIGVFESNFQFRMFRWLLDLDGSVNQ